MMVMMMKFQTLYLNLNELDGGEDKHLSTVLYNKYVKESNIPKRYLKEVELKPYRQDIKLFYDLKEIEDNINQFVIEGKNLLLYSNNVGNGKTTWACKLGLSYIEYMSDYMSKFTPVLFINVGDFLNMKKLAIENDLLKEKVNDIESRILNAKLVIFDDVVVRDLSQYDLMTLYFWINERTSNEKSCIYTTNFSLNELREILGAKVGDRVMGYSISKEFKGKSSRNN